MGAIHLTKDMISSPVRNPVRRPSTTLPLSTPLPCMDSRLGKYRAILAILLVDPGALPTKVISSPGKWMSWWRAYSSRDQQACP
jgi:hypothetical protein